MSMWMIAVNQMVNQGRAHAAASVKRDTRKVGIEASTVGVQSIFGFWKYALIKSTGVPPKPRTSRKPRKVR